MNEPIVAGQDRGDNDENKCSSNDCQSSEPLFFHFVTYPMKSAKQESGGHHIRCCRIPSDIFTMGFLFTGSYFVAVPSAVFHGTFRLFHQDEIASRPYCA
jgi:hypothetical protein